MTQPLPLIPAPQYIERPTTASASFSPMVHATEDSLTQWGVTAQEVTQAVHAFLGEHTSFAVVSATDSATGPAIMLQAAGADEQWLAPLDGGVVAGAHRISITEPGVEVTAAEFAGIRHAFATLAQLKNVATPTPALGQSPTFTFPLVTIVDAPTHSWRGFSLDVVRRFYPVPEIYQIIDLLAGLKFNTLHLHLTDDQGWRYQVPERPELTTIGGAYATYDRPGGYYTTEEAQHIGEYAAVRGIAVVPEVDLPGHINAALHAIPELNPDGKAREAYHGIEVGFSYLDPELPATYSFIDDVVGAACAISTSGYVHVGGDEVLQLPAEQFAKLVEYACEVVQRHGLTPVVWQEGVRAKLPAGTPVQYWNSNEGTAEVAEKTDATHPIILSPSDRVYLDMKPEEDFPLGLVWSGIVPLEQSYTWNPEDVFTGEAASRVIGVEGAIWSETITSLQDFLTLALPRLYAVAEVAWTPSQQRDFADFSSRLAQLPQD